MPAYNVGNKIESVYSTIPPEVYAMIDSFIIVVGSTHDDTLEKAKKIQQKIKNVIIVAPPLNPGYGGAQKMGFRRALNEGADVCVLLHSDGQCDSHKIPELVKPILEGTADVILGSRMLNARIFKTTMPLYKYFGNRILTFCENVAFHSAISEFHTGYIAYSKQALQKIPYEKLDDQFHFDGNMIVMALIHKLKIAEISVPTIYEDEKSNLKVFSYAWDILKTIWKYKRGYYHRLQ